MKKGQRKSPNSTSLGGQELEATQASGNSLLCPKYIKFWRTCKCNYTIFKNNLKI